MGYEVKIYCGIRSNYPDTTSENEQLEPVATYMEIIAMIDLCKVSDLSPSQTGPLVYFYGADGNIQITEDWYGDKCRTYPVSEMLAVVKKASKHTPDYRRWKPAIALLESLVDFPGDEIECFVFGH